MATDKLKLGKLGQGLNAIRERRPSFADAMKNPFGRKSNANADNAPAYKYSYKEMSKNAKTLWSKDSREMIAREFAQNVILKGYGHALRRNKTYHGHSFEEVQRYMSPERKKRMNFDDNGNDDDDDDDNDDNNNNNNNSNNNNDNDDNKNYDGNEYDDNNEFNTLFHPINASKYAIELDELYSTPSPQKPPPERFSRIPQENIWTQVERVFRTTARKKIPTPPPVIVPEVIEEIVKPPTPRVPFNWKDRVTWLDELIAMSNANYGGSDGGIGGEVPSLIKQTKRRQTEDWLKSGEPWARTRTDNSKQFLKLLIDKKAAKKRIDEKLFK